MKTQNMIVIFICILKQLEQFKWYFHSYWDAKRLANTWSNVCADL